MGVAVHPITAEIFQCKKSKEIINNNSKPEYDNIDWHKSHVKIAACKIDFLVN